MNSQDNNSSSETHPERHVVGISAVTTNAAEMQGGDAARIPALWQRFMTEDVLAQIPNRLNSDGRPDAPRMVALYTDLASDEHGEYRIVLGALVKDLSEIPDGMVGRSVPAGVYERFTSERGPIAAVTVAAWQRVWGNSALKARRKYAGDLELYDERSANPEDAQIDLLIGVRGK